MVGEEDSSWSMKSIASAEVSLTCCLICGGEYFAKASKEDVGLLSDDVSWDGVAEMPSADITGHMAPLPVDLLLERACGVC